jgi:transposase-like protein
MECKDCKGTKYTKAGMAYSGKKKVQRWVCVNCRRTTTINPNVNVVEINEINK